MASALNYEFDFAATEAELQIATQSNKSKAGLGLEYLEEVEYAINFLIRYPEAGSIIRGSIRRLILPKFPYYVLLILSARKSTDSYFGISAP